MATGDCHAWPPPTTFIRPPAYTFARPWTARLAAWIRVTPARFDAVIPGVKLGALLDVLASCAHGHRADAVLLNVARRGVVDLIAHALDYC